MLPNNLNTETAGRAGDYFAHLCQDKLISTCLFFADVHISKFDFSNLVHMLDADGACDFSTWLMGTRVNVGRTLQ